MERGISKPVALERVHTVLKQKSDYIVFVIMEMMRRGTKNKV
jgi:hypothetical protein